MKQSLSPKELAQMIGVSESSLKRWADSGRVRFTRTMGGHRRISIQEAVRFARESQLPVVKPELLGITQSDIKIDKHRSLDADEAGKLLENFLVDGQADAARGLLLDLYLKGKSVAWLCDGPIRYAMGKVGELWQHQSEGIFLEHHAFDICINTLAQIRTLLSEPAESALPDDGPSKPIAIGCAPANDPYLMGSMASACVLAETGYHDINLGANLPLASLVQAAERYRPRLVWLSCSFAEACPSPKQIDDLANQLEKLGAKLVVGGAANPRGAGLSENLRVCESMTELGAFGGGLISA